MKRRARSLKKKPIDPERIRRIPAEGFSWVDRRFVREGFLEPLPAEAILLYLFLVSVADAEGLSFYADPTISRILKLNPEELSQSRARLLSAELILYEYPLYQILPLPAKAAEVAATSSSAQRKTRCGDPVSGAELLRAAITKGVEGVRAARRNREEKARVDQEATPLAIPTRNASRTLSVSTLRFTR